MPRKLRWNAVAGVALALLATVAPSANAATTTLAPAADTYVDASLPNNTYGSNAKLRTDGSPAVRSYLRFDVQGWAPGASTATLRLMPTSNLATGLQVSQVASTTWPEASTNAGNAPALGAQIGTTSPPTAGTWLTLDVTAAITGNGPVSLALSSTNATAEALASREAGAATAPQLVISTVDADVTPPAPVLSGPADGATLSTATPTISGTAGTAAGDESTVSVKLWQGTDTTGPPQQTLPAAALAGGSFSVSPGAPLADGRYTVQVEQRDTAGNVGRSATRGFTVASSPPASTTLTPTADSWVDASLPTTNYGTNVKLRTDGSPVIRSYLRFDVTGFSPGATKATLRVMPTSSLATGLQVHRADDTAWGERTINYSNAPSLTSTIGTTAPPAAGTWLTLDVTGAITGNGPVTLALASSNATAEALASRESGANSPQLVLESSDTAAPTPALTSPGDGSTTTDTTPAFTGSAGTAAGDQATVEVPIWNGTGTAGPPFTTLTTTADPTTGAFTAEPSTPLDGGTYTARAEQLDAAGNRGRSTPVTFTVDVPDTTAPEVTLTTPPDGSTTSDPTPTLAGKAGTKSTDSGTVRVRVWSGTDTSATPVLDLNASRSATDGSYSVDASPALADGDYTARADQDDAAGNTGHSADVHFTVAASDPTIAAAGDIVCPPGTSSSSGCRQMQTSDLLLALNPNAVLALGDLQYENGEYANFLSMYDPSWGRLKSRTYPVPGNHEYGNSVNAGCDVTTAGDPRAYACGYFDYFNGKGNLTGRAGQRGQGYYAFDVGQWRLYALNSNCERSGAPTCAATGPMVQWLRADLAAHPTQCQLMFMHYPLYSSDVRDYDTATWRTRLRPLWDAFQDAGGEAVLVGHSHFYERYVPMRPDGTTDPDGGIQQFIVGTGGRNLQASGPNVEPNRAVFSSSAFGVLAMTLHASSYDWHFAAIPGQTNNDAGTRACH